MIAVDTNILVYAHREDSPHHAEALREVKALAGAPGQWAIPWPCLHEFLAIVTHPRIYQPATEVAVAIEVVEALRAVPTLQMLSETADHSVVLGQLLRESGVAGPKIHDARVAAICLSHGVSELRSADRDFSWFPQLRVVNPLRPLRG